MRVLDFEPCPDWEDWPEGCASSALALRKCYCRQAAEKRPIILVKRAYGYVVEWEEENLI